MTRERPPASPMTRCAARDLRRAVSQPRRSGDDACLKVVASCPADKLDVGNANRKTALMLAAQFRPTAVVVEALLARGVNVDLTTRRGHTALVFASGRGRADSVRALLRAGASARVRTVTGDTALDMARGRVAPDVEALLERAEAAEDRPWRVTAPRRNNFVPRTCRNRLDESRRRRGPGPGYSAIPALLSIDRTSAATPTRSPLSSSTRGPAPCVGRKWTSRFRATTKRTRRTGAKRRSPPRRSRRSTGVARRRTRRRSRKL